jgi:hypothetical protein
MNNFPPLIYWDFNIVESKACSPNKKSLKGDQDGVFITENLTKYRTELVKRLSQLKFHRQIYTYWTSDGRIYVKKLETSRKQLVTNFDDIENIRNLTMTCDFPLFTLPITWDLPMSVLMMSRPSLVLHTVKKLETSRKQLVTNFDDIENIECSVHEQTASQTSDTGIYH